MEASYLRARQGTPRTSCQFIAGPTQRDKQALTFTRTDNLALPISLTCMSLEARDNPHRLKFMPQLLKVNLPPCYQPSFIVSNFIAEMELCIYSWMRGWLTMLARYSSTKGDNLSWHLFLWWARLLSMSSEVVGETQSCWDFHKQLITIKSVPFELNY